MSGEDVPAPAGDPSAAFVDPKLRRMAEAQMRRSAEPMAKKLKVMPDIGRFDYNAPEKLEAGAQGLILTSIFDR